MDADLQPVTDALADLDDHHLHSLIETANAVAQVAPGLLAWLEGAADWEQNRRRGLDFPLLPPDAAIPPEEDAISINAAGMLRATFAQDERAEARGGDPAAGCGGEAARPGAGHAAALAHL